MRRKKCSRCRVDKGLTKFHKNKSTKDGLHHYCKKCNSDQKKETYKKHSDRLLIEARLKKYDLSIEEIDDMYQLQNQSCAICEEDGKHPLESGGLHIDHCHQTNKVRGIGLLDSCFL
jgi:hypothetical protein